MLDGSVKLIAQCSQAAGFVSSGTPQPEAVTDPRMVAACSETKAHGQILQILRGCSSRSRLQGPVTVSLQHGGCGVGVCAGCPILLSDLFYEVKTLVAWSRPL